MKYDSMAAFRDRESNESRIYFFKGSLAPVHFDPEAFIITWKSLQTFNLALTSF